MELFESQQTFAPVCLSQQSTEQPSGLIIKDQDDVIKSPDPAIAPIKTSMGDIYPARGIVKTDEGQVILTRDSTDNTNTRTSRIFVNCN